MNGKAILIVLDPEIGPDAAADLAADLQALADTEATVIGWPPDPTEIRTLLEPT